MKYIIVSRRRGMGAAFYYQGNFYWHIYETFETKDEAYAKVQELSTTIVPGQFLSVTTEDNYQKIWAAA